MSALTKSESVVVVGAGQAGYSVCERLRAEGFEGTLTLIGEEPLPPYQRPPLSKAYLLGEMTLDRLYLRPDEFYTTQKIDLRVSTKVASLDAAEKHVTLADGATVPYDKLVLATGSTPITLPAAIGGDLDGLHYVRSVADADKMEADFKNKQTVLVVGGGYIGLEAAAVAKKLGMSVVLVEAAERILQRVAGVQTSDFLRGLHQARGVDIREGTTLERLNGQNGRVTSATLSDGSTINVDCVVVGIGIRPNVVLAEAAGLDIENGIKVDSHCQTSNPDIFAIGDCASFLMGETRLRLESVGNAIDQGEFVARALMGSEDTFEAKPWFWSDQYEHKLQMVGLSMGHDRVVTRDTGEHAKSFWYYKGDDLLAVDAVNDPRAYMVAKRVLEQGKSADATLVANPEINLKELLK